MVPSDGASGIASSGASGGASGIASGGAAFQSIASCLTKCLSLEESNLCGRR